MIHEYTLIDAQNIQITLQAQGSEAPLRREFTMIHGKDTYFKQIETTQL